MDFGVSFGAERGFGLLWQQGPRKGEVAGVTALFVFSLAIRSYRLDLYPAGPGFVESMMSLVSGYLGKTPYTPHVTEPLADFPSLVFYQGLAAAKAFGWKIQNFRIPAALWGTLSVLAFYFFLRQWTSALAAGIFSFLYSANNLQLTLSRLFFPGTLLYFSLAATAAFLCMGMRKGGSWRYVAAGLLCGLSLHGYVSGRYIPPFFAAWLMWVAWAGRRRNGTSLRPRDLLYFSAACLLVAAPVLWWAYKNPDAYWFFVTYNGGGSLFNALTSALHAFPDYLKMFYTEADGILKPVDGLALYPVLRPDVLTQIFFPLGLLACLAMVRKPLPALILGGFLLGILPAAATVTYAHPCTRRALLVLPWVYAAAGLAWDQIVGVVTFGPGKLWVRRLFVGATILMASMGVAWSLHQYFLSIMSLPSMRNAYCGFAGAMADELERYPHSEVKVSYDLVEPETCRIAYPKDESSRTLDKFQNFLVLDWPQDVPVTAIKQFEDFLVMSGDRPQLLLMSPYLMSSLPLLQSLFPNGHAYVYGSGGEGEVLAPSWDPFEPEVQLVRFQIPVQDVEAFKGMVDLFQPPYAFGARVNVWKPDTLESRRGLPEDLGAVLVIQDERAIVRFQLPWPAWKLRVDGQARAWEKDLALSTGAHRIEVSGKVPMWDSVKLPLRILCQGQDLVGLGRLVPVDPRPGFQAELKNINGSGGAFRFELLPSHRFAPPEGLQTPYSMVMRANLTVPWTGVCAFRIRPPGKGSVRLGGQVIYDSSAGTAAAQTWSRLASGHSEKMEIDGEVDSQTARLSTLAVDFRKLDSEEWKALPFDWVEAR